MKKALFSIVFLFISCDSPRIVKLEIYKVDFEISTPFSIDCNNFEHSFENEFKSVTIENKEDLKLFSSYLKNIQVDSEGYMPDVRAKVFIYYSNRRIDTLCLSRLGMVFHGKSFLINKNIKRFVESK